MTAQKPQQQQQQHLIIANTLRSKIDANYFTDYIAPFIFYKYLSTKIELYANAILATPP
jgi:type I restriction enzyme M protein